MATLGNGLVATEVLGAKPGPSCKSFENRNNPVKPDSFLGVEFYEEHCQNMGNTVCGYIAPTEELANDLRQQFLAECAKQNQ